LFATNKENEKKMRVGKRKERRRRRRRRESGCRCQPSFLQEIN
jgi:hypothetical protein